MEVKCRKLAQGKILIILKDITLYKELEKHRTKNRLKTLFLASFAHELLTPINIINGMCDEAVCIATSLHEGLNNTLVKTKCTIQKLIFLVDDIIDLSKYELTELVM